MKHVSTLGIALLLVAVQAQAADFGRWGISYNNEDNVNRAAWAADKRSDDIIGLKYLSGRFTATDKGGGYSLSYQTQYQNYLTYHGMTHMTLDGSASYRHKFGLGHNVWWWKTGIDAGYGLYADADRSNLHVSADVRLGKRFLDRWNGQLFYRYINEDATATVYDRSGSELGMQLNFSLSNRWMFYASSMQYQGDITVSQSWAPAGTTVKASATDNVFGMTAYRVDVSTAITRYGMNYAMGKTSSLDLSMESWAAQGVQNPAYWYYKNIIRLSFNKVI